MIHCQKLRDTPVKKSHNMVQIKDTAVMKSDYTLKLEETPVIESECLFQTTKHSSYEERLHIKI
jgi:hypothetical protein